jgi:hypothetical protein
MQRLHGGPCSAPTHFILRRRQTVQALQLASQEVVAMWKASTDLEPLVGLTLGSLPSTETAVPSSSLRRLMPSLSLSKVLEEGGRLLEPGNGICSVGGVLIASEAWEEGDETTGPSGS